MGIVSIGKVYVRENKGKCWQIISKEREGTGRGREGGRARGKEDRRVVGREKKKEREGERGERVHETDTEKEIYSW